MPGSDPQLKRSISLLQASAINMIDMVGIGPFVVMPLVMQLMGENTFLLAWIAGAVIALVDGMVWAELGAAMPAAGGSYQFLKAAYGKGKWGQLMPFLFVWQTLFQAPLVVASGAIGFAQYFTYLLPVGWLGKKMISGAVVILLTGLLYRKIDAIGKISVLLWSGVIITILWIIIGGMTHAHVAVLPSFRATGGATLHALFWGALGHATVKSMYSFLGYYNVCHLGGEIKRPERNIPLSIFISVIGIAVLYIGMNMSIVQVVPWKEARNSEFIVSIFIERAYGKGAAMIATLLVLWIAFSSLFAVMLGYSRIPYAAAADGNFFPVFSKLHPRKNFPHLSLLALGGAAFVFSLLFRLTDVISAILAMRILVQFIGQAAGLIILRKRNGSSHLPFKMWLYPLPVILTIIAWIGIFISTGRKFAISGIIMTGIGTIVFFLLRRRKTDTLFMNKTRLKTAD